MFDVIWCHGALYLAHVLQVNDLLCCKMAECQEKSEAVKPIVTGSFNSLTIMSFAWTVRTCVHSVLAFNLSHHIFVVFNNNFFPTLHPLVVSVTLRLTLSLCVFSQWRGWRWWRLRNVAVTLRSWGRRWPLGTTGLFLFLPS